MLNLEIKCELGKFERLDCYHCGEDVFIDSNSLNENGDECYKNDDKYGVPMIFCVKHLWY